ncbi:MAG: ribonuclease P protein component [Caedimonas sp.]|nr:ribonuclease P protein component [Caedimonas sp.]
MLSLKKRHEFSRLQKEGVRWVASSFILQMISSETQDIRVGYIVTRKMGSAVTRNRARRRLKEAVRLTFPTYASDGQDYVLIARTSALTQTFKVLQKDLLWSLRHVQRLKREKDEG